MTPPLKPGDTNEATGAVFRASVAASRLQGLRSDPAASGWLEIRIPAPAEWLNSNDRRHRMADAKITKAWRLATSLACRNIGPLNWPVEITAHIWKPRNNRYDPGNLYPTAKACVDGLVDAGLLPDDDHTHVTGPDMRHGGKGPAEIVLKIRGI